jgi:hypothetical protein
MALTPEDLDRRVTALEKAAETEKNIVRAVSEIVADSEKRMRAAMSDSEKGMRADMSELRADMSELRADMSELRAETKVEIGRLGDRISATERRFTDLLNERFDAVMTAIDRLQNPPA